MIPKQEAYDTIGELVERFHEQLPSYKKSDYNETLVRRDFVDPFFKALGWDVDNSQGYAEAYREVIHEDRVKVSGATKAPDYSFRLPGGKRLFFVEAKKPSIAVKTDILPAYQVRRYAWSAKLPISILTDFEELAVYDCNKKPNPTDKASAGRIKYLTYDQYLGEFDFIWNTFSKERVLKGGLDKFIAGDSYKKGTTTVDKEFLASLDEWRIQLAYNIALRNPAYTEDELNFTVQQTIDRIIFLRIAEDRGVEVYGRLQQSIAAKTKGAGYANLFDYFREADEKYNSGLFDFDKDKISASLVIDDKVLKDIITQLYYPVSPYEFSVLSVEILGSAYEQFLGKQIKLNDKHKVVIEEKPEVRKAGGVYYTPQYIVEYIVENTIGKLTAGKTPAEVAEIKIVDPACGSGSFLIGAFDYLLKWHLNYYKPEFITLSETAANTTVTTKVRETAIKQRSKLPLTPDGNLTTSLKKQILLNNIYGVDLDTQAVEVTKLSLLLKCMEGETGSSINAEMRFGERVLPTLDNNIKSGNSLIDLDFYETVQSSLSFGEGRGEVKIKPFSWQKAFPTVFNPLRNSDKPSRNPGFDVVIGNPPYVRQEMLSDIKPYLQKAYKVYHGMADLYSYFFERGIGLLNENGLFGIIVANKWMRANYGEPLRKWFKQQEIQQIIDFGDLPVFQNATTYPCIVISKKAGKRTGIEPVTAPYVVDVKTLEFESLGDYVSKNKQSLVQDKLEDAGWHLGNETEQNLIQKIRQAGIPLGEYVNKKIFVGIKTGYNEAFLIDKLTRDKLIKDDAKSAEIIKPYIVGRNIKRYCHLESTKFIIFLRRGIDINEYHAIKKFLWNYKDRLTPKPKDYNGSEWGGRKGGAYKWFEIQDPVDYYKEFDQPKIVYAEISTTGNFTLDTTGMYIDMTAFTIGSAELYLLGILNSALCKFFFSTISSEIRGGFLRWKRQYVENIPIKKTDAKNKIEKNLYNEITSFVKSLLDLNKQKQTTTLSEKIEQLNQRIAYTDEKINKLVYELYGLSDEEVGIVGGR